MDFRITKACVLLAMSSETLGKLLNRCELQITHSVPSRVFGIE